MRIMTKMQNKSCAGLRTVLVAAALTMLQSLAAQTDSTQISGIVSNVEKAFVTMPDQYYMTLTQEMRILMVDRLRKGEEPKVRNHFGGDSRIDSIDQQNDWMRIRNSESGALEIKVLQTQGKPSAIFLVFTACAPACSSHTGVFTLDWRLLPSSVLSNVSINDFLDMDKIKEDGKKEEYVTSLLDLQLVDFSFAGDHKTLKATLNSEKELSQEDRDKVAPYIKTRQITFVWDGTSFVRQ